MFLKKYSKLFLFGFLLLFVSSFYITQYRDFFEPITTDGIRVALGAERLIEKGEIQPDYEVLGGTANVEARGSLYPFIQINVAILSDISGISTYHAIFLFYLIIFVILALTLYILLGRFTKSRETQIISFLLSILFLPLLRSILLTPQNLIGYLLIVTIINLLFLVQGKKLLLLLFMIIGCMAFYHHLTLFIVLIFLFVYLITGKHFSKLLVFFVISLAAVFLASKILLGSYDILFFVKSIFSSFFSPSELDYFNLNTPLDFPYVLGIYQTLLGIFGALILALSRKKFVMGYHIAISLGFVILFLSNILFFGIGFHPDRFLNYLFIPLALCIPLCIDFIKNIFFVKRRLIATGLCAFIIIVSFVQNVSVSAHEQSYFGETFILSRGELEAAEFLKKKMSDTEVVLIASRERTRKADSYARYLGNKKTLIFDEPSLASIPQKNEQSLRFDIWQMTVFPSIKNSEDLFKKYGVEFFLFPAGSKERIAFENFSYVIILFENENVVIFAKKK
ncbi:hypothetical protein KKH43_02485 [Patescibacteria group bacterium]|nr:hypothetical protein [Patescibacteria group bacterium]